MYRKLREWEVRSIDGVDGLGNDFVLWSFDYFVYIISGLGEA